MTELDNVAALVKAASPHGICDDCIAVKLEFPTVRHASHHVQELSKVRGFIREKDLCHLCGQNRQVIIHV